MRADGCVWSEPRVVAAFLEKDEEDLVVLLFGLVTPLLFFCLKNPLISPFDPIFLAGFLFQNFKLFSFFQIPFSIEKKNRLPRFHI